jgi:hypothetical protein
MDLIEDVNADSMTVLALIEQGLLKKVAFSVY